MQMPSQQVDDLSITKDILLRIRDNGISIIEPAFAPGGLAFKDFGDLEPYRVAESLKVLERGNLLTAKPFSSILRCRNCDSFRFHARFICAACKMPNVTRGAVIEHLICGNIDFDERFLKDGALQCNKCNKRLNAIGVDYSRPGYFYRCSDCLATLPDKDVQYICINCGTISAFDELQVQQLFSYVVNQERMAEIFIGKKLDVDNSTSTASENDDKKPAYLSKAVVEILNKIGITSACPDLVAGLSKIKHHFELVVYDEAGLPILLADPLYSDNTKQESDTFQLMKFQAKCDDVILAVQATVNMTEVARKAIAQNSKQREPNGTRPEIKNWNQPVSKILIAMPTLSEEASKLADAYQITVIRAVSAEEVISQIIEIILKTYEDSKAKLKRVT